MNGLFKAWVAAALPLILNVETVRCPAAAIQVTPQDTQTIAGPIATEATPGGPALWKFKSEWDYLNTLDAVPRTLATPDARSDQSAHADADATIANWNGVAPNPAATSDDSKRSANPDLQATPNAVPAIVRAPGDGWQTLAAIVLVVAFTATRRRRTIKVRAS